MIANKLRLAYPIVVVDAEYIRKHLSLIDIEELKIRDERLLHVNPL
jgi:hypothetical protein